MDEREQGCCREGLCIGLSEVRQDANCKGIQILTFYSVLELVSYSSSGLFCLFHFDKILHSLSRTCALIIMNSILLLFYVSINIYLCVNS
jgi:hypothetical protein